MMKVAMIAGTYLSVFVQGTNLEGLCIDADIPTAGCANGKCFVNQTFAGKTKVIDNYTWTMKSVSVSLTNGKVIADDGDFVTDQVQEVTFGFTRVRHTDHYHF